MLTTFARLASASQNDGDALRTLLRELRHQKGLRQADLAERLGQPQSFVSKYETGERRLDILELRLVCRLLGLSLEAFASMLDERLSTPNTETDARRPL